MSKLPIVSAHRNGKPAVDARFCSCTPKRKSCLLSPLPMADDQRYRTIKDATWQDRCYAKYSVRLIWSIDQFLKLLDS